jgi:hypothetical protein
VGKWYGELCDKWATERKGKAERTAAMEEKDPSEEAVAANEVRHFQEIMQAWTFEADADLVKFLRKHQEKSRQGATTRQNMQTLAITEMDVKQYRALAQLGTLPTSAYQVRAQLLDDIASKIINLARFLDLSVDPGTSEMVDDIRAVRGLIPWWFKRKMWDTALSETRNTSHSQETILVDRYKSFGLRQQGRCDTKAKRTVFAQLFRLIDGKDKFRGSMNDRMWKVDFAGEASIDAGGPYRELITMMSDELQSSDLPLFVPCPNHRAHVGSNQERWVPNPTAKNKQLYIQLYEFVGKLMGMAMRTGYFLNLDLPSIVWKPLVQQEITAADIREMDILSSQILDQFNGVCHETSDEAKVEFEGLQQTYSVIGSDQKDHDLVPNGRNKLVKWEDRARFLQLLENYRFGEFKEHCAALRRGMATVVPYAVLSLFTWQEVEIETVGTRTVDVDYLQQNTEYEGHSSTDPHIRFFWQVMRNRFDNDQRIALLRFAWGRTRLPLPGQTWERKFKIASHSRSQRGVVDNYLPEAHTCFFTLDLPRYTSLEVTYEKLLFAIVNCIAVDGDGSINRGGVDMNAGDSDEEF